MTKSSKKSIAVTPVIRAKTSADAFVSSGHTHDDRYIRYDGADTLTSSEINQLLVNMLAASTTTAKLPRTDIEQSLNVTSKDQVRENIGIIDDLNLADAAGDIIVSKFGNLINGDAPANNDLTEHFVRYDDAQSLEVSEQEQIASNMDVLSLLTGLSEQTVDSSVRFAGNEYNIDAAIAKLNSGSIIKGTPLNDTQAIVSIAAPNGTETAIIKIVAGTAAATTVAMDCSGKKIVSLKDPTNAQDGATKKYVDDQITALGDVATTSHVEDSTNILSGINNATSGGLTTIQSITPVATGLYFVILSGKITSGTTHTINVVKSAATIATRTLNTDGAGQWSMTIPVDVDSLNGVSVTPPAGVVINQYDLVKFGNR